MIGFWGNPNLWLYVVLHTLTGNLWLAVPQKSDEHLPHHSESKLQNLLVKSGQLKVSIVMGGTPIYHPCQIGMFHEINQPFWGTPHDYGTPQLKSIPFGRIWSCFREVPGFADSMIWLIFEIGNL